MSTLPPLRPGQRLSNFELKQRLAMGGMAEIWAAQPVEGGSIMALKVMQPHLVGNDQFRAMFRDEVHIALRLRHEHIVRVHDGRFEDGHFFLVMDLIEGLDLRKTLKRMAQLRQWVPTPIALSVAQAMARALAYAHLRRDPRGRALEIVHRDISPHNVMLSADGGVRLLDFGIARARARLAKTTPGMVKGKVGYMAPEQALGIELDQRADIFSTGIVIWEMLAMQRLFTGENAIDTMNKVVHARVPDLRSINETVPVEAAELVHRMLAQAPKDRPASMREVETGITRVLALTYEPRAYSRARLGAWMERVVSSIPRRTTTPLEDATGVTATIDDSAPTQPTEIP